MAILYDAAVYDRTLSAGSYWDTTAVVEANYPALAQDETCEVAIIGGGITGLSAALHLARDYGIQARILEAGGLTWGASGRNGGFCCVGAAALGGDRLLKKFGQSETRRYYQAQREGTELVKQLAAEESIQIDAQGDGEIEIAYSGDRWCGLVTGYEFLTEVADYPCKLWLPKDLAEQVYLNPGACGALHIGVSFGLNPIKYTLGLARAASQHGAILHSHSPVEAWEKDGNWHLLHTPAARLRAKTVIVATNGYTEDRLHPQLGDRLLPLLSGIITTRPLTPAELEAQGWRTETPIHETHNVLFYYRLLKDGRLLFGSRGGTVGDRAENERRHRWMVQAFQEKFPVWRDVEITHSWNGLVCASATLTPHVGRLAADESVLYGFAYHGSGVSTGTWSGRALAQLVAGQAQVRDLCAIFRQPLKKFPLPALRIWYLRATFTLADLLKLSL
ncbi:MAG: FAD-binding oxidoreductase [Leptolyngbyaceae cyanobacterium SL_5_14]|nr:FAD-binding oxidoreductase [Leptolyngbyaceae cyanobacterium SL_5_14]